MTARLVVLVSGGGTNLQAVLDACASGDLDAEVVCVISNRPEAYGLERARLAGTDAIVLERDGQDRQFYDSLLADVVASYEPDLVVMAGWMRIVTMAFLGQQSEQGFRVLNLHPALPSTFPGTHAIERAFDAWEAGTISASGVMVHWVPDEGVDTGPVIIDAPVLFEAGDTLADFEERVHETEHELIVRGIEIAVAAGSAEQAGEATNEERT